MSNVTGQTQTMNSVGADHQAGVGVFIELMKPRVMSLVVLSGFVGLYLAPGSIHPFLAGIAILCIAVGAGASAAINMWYDRDIDAVMHRTRSRPIPSGRIDPETALEFGGALALASVGLMALALNLVAALILAGTIAFYVFVYTMWLKRRTPQNIVIGGAAGALPPVIGWAAVTGGVGWESGFLFLLIFLWTPPHFWALALYRNDDYVRAGVPMLPAVVGERATRRQMLVYTIVMAPVALAPTLIGMNGWVYGSVAIVMSALFVICALQVCRSESGSVAPARRMFGFSILYLFMLLTVMMLDPADGGLVRIG